MFGKKLISDILDKFLKNAAPHLAVPQSNELKLLNREQLRKILEISNFPLKKKEIKELSTFIPEYFLLRLARRVEINSSIVEAREKGIYEDLEKIALTWLKDNLN